MRHRHLSREMMRASSGSSFTFLYLHISFSISSGGVLFFGVIYSSIYSSRVKWGLSSIMIGSSDQLVLTLLRPRGKAFEAVAR